MIHVGIFGRKKDNQVKMLTDALERKGARAHVVDFFHFPKFNLCSFAGEEEGSFDDISLPTPSEFSVLDVVCLRTTVFEDLDQEKAVSYAAGRVGDYYNAMLTKVAFQFSLLRSLGQKIPVINPPDSFLFHRQKAKQHALLLENNIPTPLALITNNAGRARKFAARFEQGIVAKPQASGAEVVMADEAFFEKNFARIRTRPYMFQQYVKGRSLRAYVLGGEIVSMFEMFYDKTHVDWRGVSKEVKRYTPSITLREQINKSLKLLNLPYCGIDIEHDATTDRLYFLDFNPSALFVGWSRMTGDNIADVLAAYLIKVVNTGRVWI